MPTLRAQQGRRVQSDLNHYFGGNHFCGAIDLFVFMIAQKAPFCKARAEEINKENAYPVCTRIGMA